LKWHKSEKGAYAWLRNADHFYVAARYLYWKGLVETFAFLGAHAIELYLKAYLIQKTGCYPEGHDLIKIYNECRNHDEFFNDKSLSEHFIPREDSVYTGTDWSRYLDAIKYPEFLPIQRDRGKKWQSYGISFGFSHKSLDQIAHLIRQRIGIPEGTVGTAEALLNSNPLNAFFIGTVIGSFSEIKQAFYRENEYFRE